MKKTLEIKHSKVLHYVFFEFIFLQEQYPLTS